jgi:tRNA-intron endonuclease
LTSKPYIVSFDEDRLIIWDIQEAQNLYNSGFYGKPLGISRPKPDFQSPLLLDPIEALYLLEKGEIKVKKGNKNLSKKMLKENYEKNFEGFIDKFRVYKDLRNKGYVVTPGIKYGCDFAVYENGPGLDHAPYVVQIIDVHNKIGATEIIKSGRLATTVRKSFILALINSEIKYLEFNWWKA